MHSQNIRPIASLTKQGPFAQDQAWSTDLAFQGTTAIAGNYEGFTIYDISRPAQPTVLSQVVCPAAQNDVSVSGNLLFLSVDEPRGGESCENRPASPIEAASWEGIRIFDISDKRKPQYVTAVRTDCGSHTHTLVPDKRGKADYLYVSSYGPRPHLAHCKPPHDKISIVEVPRDNPKSARVISQPVLFPDDRSRGAIDPLGTSGCHDITVYPEKDLAAGACMGDGLLMDISDRTHPRVIHQVQDTNFAFWHSATFNNKATKVVFGDELGGGLAPTCNESIGPKRGANGIYEITGTGDARRLVFRGYFKIPRVQTAEENCVAHNGALFPVAGRDIMVQGWYQGGVSVFDFTDSANAKEIAFFERGPVAGRRSVGGSWSAYYYNGHIYSSDIQEGLDVLDLTDPIAAFAKTVRLTVMNPQTQTSYAE